MNSNETKNILEEEKKILREERKILRIMRNAWTITALIAVILVGGAALFAYLKISGGAVYTDKAEISAPQIDLAPQTSGVLQNIFAHSGDKLNADAVVAQVGNELVKTKSAGIVISVKNNLGKLVNRGEPVVSLIDPAELRAIGHIDEDKGLSDVRIGERAIFTVDAFGSKEYEGVVDEISPTSRAGDIVFNISDKRQIQQFDVKIRFDVDKYPELKNGMSAKLWIYKQ